MEVSSFAKVGDFLKLLRSEIVEVLRADCLDFLQVLLRLAVERQFDFDFSEQAVPEHLEHRLVAQIYHVDEMDDERAVGKAGLHLTYIR